jgi:hypothetical protein
MRFSAVRGRMPRAVATSTDSLGETGLMRISLTFETFSDTGNSGLNACAQSNLTGVF